MMRRKFLLLGAILTGIAMAGLAPPARAGFALRVSDGTHTLIVHDGGAGDGDPSTVGSIVVSTGTLTAGGIVGWSQINVSTAFSNLTSGDQFAMLEVGTSARANSSGPLTSLTIDVTQTDFTVPVNNPGFVMTSTVVATSVPGNETVQGFYDSVNPSTEFSIPGQFSTPQQTVTSGVAPSNPTIKLIVPGVSPFSLSLREVLNPTANGQFFSTDNELTVSVPEPSGIALFGCGAFCIAGYVRKRRKVKAA